MEGIIQYIDVRGYGFIKGDNGTDYYFHYTSLRNCQWDELTIGDKVSFASSDKDKEYYKRSSALNIVKLNNELKTMRLNSTRRSDSPTPGILPGMTFDGFIEEEICILRGLGKTFYVTNCGIIHLGEKSEYRYCLIKPSADFEMQFNLKRELVVIFSRYENFEPRTFDAVSKVFNKIKQPLRLDKICSIIISKDSDAVNKINESLKSATEMQVIIPFSYHELPEGNHTELIINRFKKYFFERDLFAFENPLNKDIYFFGRKTYVNELMNRHKSGENSGVFGLRRSGKTSVLKAVSRAAKISNSTCVFIDCEKIYHQRWYNALHFTMKEIAEAADYKEVIKDNKYTEKDASISFSEDLKSVLEKTTDIILMFDEVERIAPNLSADDNWKIKDDFTMFWQPIRSSAINWGSRFTFILSGTNPSVIELTSINKHDNPLFNQIKTDSYLPSFEVEDTKEMVNKLGGYMGLRFDDIVCSRLTQDFGGHPYLIRHFCSTINEYVNKKKWTKPIDIKSALYKEIMPIFEKEADNYCKLILEVLVNCYPEEYEFLKKLALEDRANEYNTLDPQILSHLKGYNIIENNRGVLAFRIEILKNYLLRKNAYKKQSMTAEEKRNEISERRNSLEINLRKIVKFTLKIKHNENGAKEILYKSADYSYDDNSPRVKDYKSKYGDLPYDDLFNPNKCEIYFSQLITIINKNWTDFENIFSDKKYFTIAYLSIINKYRVDAHAAEITDAEMNLFRGAMEILETDVRKNL